MTFVLLLSKGLVDVVEPRELGRDPKTKRSVSAWYDAPKDKKDKPMTPAEVGTLVDEHVDPRDISGTIVHLAIRGFLKIKETKGKGILKKSKEYEFVLLNKDYDKDLELKEHEKSMLKKLFADGLQVTTKDLAKSFYRKAKNWATDLYKHMMDAGFFPHNPEKVRNFYYILGVVGFMTFNIPLGIVSFVFGKAMPRKTLFGAKKRSVALGLKNFLTSQKRQLKFQAENWYMFEKLLPYAVVFGAEKVWAKRFEHITMKPPDWYEGSYRGRFNSVLLVSSLSRSMTRMNTVSRRLSSTTSSSGFSSGFCGGSVGGGFGGGGGGSW